MAITVPVAGDEISAASFGAPVANQLNANAATLATLNARMTNAHWGILGRSKTITSGPTATTTITNMPGTDVMVTPVVGRRYRITMEGLGVVSVATNVMNIRVRDNASVVYAQWSMGPTYANAGWTFNAFDFWEPASATAINFKISYFIQLGAGNCYIYADNQPGGATYLVIEDVGPVTPVVVP